MKLISKFHTTQGLINMPKPQQQTNGNNNNKNVADSTSEMVANKFPESVNSCVRQIQENKYHAITIKEERFPSDFDHMYASMGDHGSVVSEIRQLKELLLLHLDLIQQQSEQIVQKDKQIQQLKQENDTLKQKLDRMDRRITLNHNKRQTNEPEAETSKITMIEPSKFSFSNLSKETTISLQQIAIKVEPPSPPEKCSTSLLQNTSLLQKTTTNLLQKANISLLSKATTNALQRTNANLVQKAVANLTQKINIAQKPSSGNLIQKITVPSGSIVSSGGKKATSITESNENNKAKRPSELTVSIETRSRAKTPPQAPQAVKTTTTLTPVTRTTRSSTNAASAEKKPVVKPVAASATVVKRPSTSTPASICEKRQRRTSIKPNDSTPVLYYCPAESPFCNNKSKQEEEQPVEPEKPSQASLEVPSWRIKQYSSCYSMEGTENLEDEIFLKRHQRLEVDERRRKRWDIQRLREQRQYEKLKQRQQPATTAVASTSGKKSVTTTVTSKGTSKNNSTKSTIIPIPQDQDEDSNKLWPDLETLEYIIFEDSLPVTAFGVPVPAFAPSFFDLYWKFDKTTISTPELLLNIKQELIDPEEYLSSPLQRGTPTTPSLIVATTPALSNIVATRSSSRNKKTISNNNSPTTDKANNNNNNDSISSAVRRKSCRKR